MYRGNLLRTCSGKYYLLDFDTSCNAFPIYDIMIMCNSTNYFDFDEKGFQKSKSTYESFLKGYAEYCILNTPSDLIFFQAADGIRETPGDWSSTCALPISTILK